MGADEEENRTQKWGQDGGTAAQDGLSWNLKRSSQTTSHLVVEKDMGQGGNVHSFNKHTAHRWF